MDVSIYGNRSNEHVHTVQYSIVQYWGSRVTKMARRRGKWDEVVV